MWNIKTTLALIAAALVMLTGCGKASTPPTVPTAKMDATPTIQPIVVTPEQHVMLLETRHEGKAVASVEERIFLSDVVVKARFVSAGNNVLNFRAVQYLKGSGPDRFSVRAKTAGRDTRWDNQDAILFLDRLTGAASDFRFIDTTEHDLWDYRGGPPTRYTGDLPQGYTVAKRNPVWLPVGSADSLGGLTRLANSQSSPNSIITEYDKSGAPETITQRELRDSISWLGRQALTGTWDSFPNNLADSFTRNVNTDDNPQFTTEDVRLCMLIALGQIRDRRDKIAYFGKPQWPNTWEEKIDSGLPKGTEFSVLDNDDDGWTGSIPGPQGSHRYPTYWLTGPDANLFEVTLSDDDNNSRTGYRIAEVTRRLLPAGTYVYEHRGHGYINQACGYVNEHLYTTVTVVVTAPPGTVHEALFDPATTTAGVGYLATTSTTTGVLEPAGFSMRGRDINITGLEWRDGQVVLSFDRTVQLSDGLSFIETDGTAGLYLSQFDATEDLRARTATWEVSERPWESGDELMLRIGPIPLPAVGNLTAERGSDGEVVLSWEVDYTAGVNGYRIWRYLPWRDEGPRVYVADTLSTDTTYTDVYASTSDLAEYSVQAIGRGSDAGERSEGVRIGGP